MKQRLDWGAASPDALKAMVAFEGAMQKLGLEKPLIELIKLRASQINGCAYCVDMHARDARKRGESERRLYALAVWRAANLFTPRERAALAWTDALTLLPQTGAPDEDYALIEAEFSEAERANLTVAIAAINAWNRFGVGFRLQLPAE